MHRNAENVANVVPITKRRSESLILLKLDFLSLVLMMQGNKFNARNIFDLTWYGFTEKYHFWLVLDGKRYRNERETGRQGNTHDVIPTIFRQTYGTIWHHKISVGSAF
jgi:hypothetical protein